MIKLVNFSLISLMLMSSILVAKPMEVQMNKNKKQKKEERSLNVKESSISASALLNPVLEAQARARFL